MLKLPPYGGNVTKEFWSRRGDRTISKWYLLALLLQEEKQLTMAHGLKRSEYERLVSGKVKHQPFRFTERHDRKSEKAKATQDWCRRSC